MRQVLCAMWLVVLVPAVACAQALLDRVPADAIVYVGWAGARELADDYEGTHTQGIVEASQLKDVFARTWPTFVAGLSDKEPDALPVLRSIETAARIGWNHPVALYIDAPKRGTLSGAMLIDAGDEADAVAGLVNEFIAAAPPEARATAVRDGAIVGWRFGPGEGGQALPAPPQSIRTNASFAAAMGQVHQSPAIVAYVNIAALRTGAESLPDDIRQRLAVLNHLIHGFDAVAWSGAFEGRQWGTRAFIAAPAPRRGMATLLDGEPVSDQLLRAIPRSADWLVIRRLDLGKLFNETRSALEKADPELARMFDMGMGGATMALGGNVQDTLLNPLGDQWALYTAPTVTGSGLLGGVLLNRVDDPARINRGLSNLALLITNSISGQLPRGGNRQPVMRLLLQQHTYNGTRISYINSPLITPSWAIRDNLLCFGLFPQTVAGALDAAAAQADGGSILDNPDFQRIGQQLGDVAATSISFADLPRTAERNYGTLLLLAQLYMGFADLAGGDGQPLLLPPIARLKPHLTPAGRIAWVDEAGWHARTIGPFPMHNLFAGEFSALASQTAPLLAFVPVSLVQARAEAHQARQMSNMRQLAAAFHMYAQEHGGQTPPDLGALVAYVANDAALFLRADQAAMVPLDVLHGDPAALAAWVNANAHYVYAVPGRRLPDLGSAPQVIVFHEPFESARSDGTILAAFADGHVERLTVDRARTLLQEQEARK